MILCRSDGEKKKEEDYHSLDIGRRGKKGGDRVCLPLLSKGEKKKKGTQRFRKSSKKRRKKKPGT